MCGWEGLAVGLQAVFLCVDGRVSSRPSGCVLVSGWEG